MGQDDALKNFLFYFVVFNVEMLAQQRQSVSEPQTSRPHHRPANKRRMQEGSDTNLVFANLTR